MPSTKVLCRTTAGKILFVSCQLKDPNEWMHLYLNNYSASICRKLLVYPLVFAFHSVGILDITDLAIQHFGFGLKMKLIHGIVVMRKF
ncbi:hypothetical protein DXT88_00100 [Herbaspirillum lusitanum]|nr:hypothetical protein [Herbaspirillum lusitanum]